MRQVTCPLIGGRGMTGDLSLDSGTHGGCWSVARFARSGVVPGYRDYGDPNKGLSLHRRLMGDLSPT